jgi:hypothetical protein
MSEPFNELKQVEMSIKAAQHMVGKATMGMDEGLLDGATDAVRKAREQLNSSKQSGPGTDNAFYEMSEELLQQCEEQLKEAKR